MSETTTADESIGLGETEVETPEIPITGRIVFAAMAGGLVGMVLMLPLLVGLPELFDLFRTEPIVDFANIGVFFGIEPTLTLGVLLFVFGGTLFLPLQFVVVGAFLPPERPRYLKGATFATIYWSGFVIAFWPGGSALTVGLFLVVSLLSHWVYGTTLGYLLGRATGIPQHEV